MLQQVVSQRLQMDPGTVRMPKTKNHWRHRHLALDERFKSFTGTSDVSWMKGFEWRLADQGTGRIPQHARGRRRLVFGHSVRVVNGDDVERVLHERAKPCLTFLQGVGFAAIAGRALEWPEVHDYPSRGTRCRRTLVLHITKDYPLPKRANDVWLPITIKTIISFV